MITIKGTKKEVTAVEISEYSLLSETCQFILDKYNLNPNYFLDDKGNICRDDQYRAGSSYVTIIRKASPADKKALKIVEYLNRLMESA